MRSAMLEFEQIHAAFRAKIHRYLLRMVGEYEAEDLAQEVFVKVSQALKTFRGESELSTWIYRIATNADLDRFRSPALQRSVQAFLSSSSDSPSAMKGFEGNERLHSRF